MSMVQFPSPQENLLPEDIILVESATNSQDATVLDRIKGSLVGLAVGDAVGASVEFRPRDYLVANPVHDMMSGGTWGLKAGKWTDDTSMALCLASSLITHKGFNPYDQMVRYKWWYKDGYLSSTGYCFDIGKATRDSLEEFQRRQNQLKKLFKCRTQSDVDQIPFDRITAIGFDINCSQSGAAGNGALMRLNPVPLFFYRKPSQAVELSGESARLTHGDEVAVDACRYYGALIVAAILGESKGDLLSDQFCQIHMSWFNSQKLDSDILRVAAGSFKKRRGYDDGIRGKGHVVTSLEAALWAFWSTNNFKEGVLNVINLGDDTDTTAAIYGQLAGAYYGYDKIPNDWKDKLYANKLIVCIAEWLQVLGQPDTQPVQRQRTSRNVSAIQQTTNHIDVNLQSSREFKSMISENLQQNHHEKSSKTVPRYPRSGILIQ
ncbi:unnamed protein product [Rotaria socialis]|uniref:ADP-ribosylglycohydrolase n=1 Tax=Rotaria socialis TaxID=392032 RepID=A0A820PKD4_9BILA|nr:unnamed protein product [Rotaria socialis]CAF3408230.1 unnamed protein product [Rotaria socialis]CAF3493266.1 unnamed protein product [Rotaria socialis]CAF3766321.1 unnamed protein product [Rotaria socialis]CAF4289596.1 unnamed protein product [Rotaria socialis]